MATGKKRAAVGPATREDAERVMEKAALAATYKAKEEELLARIASLQARLGVFRLYIHIC